MKENIGLLIQSISLLCFLYVIRRQLNDLFIIEDNPKEQRTKNVLFFGMLVVLILCSIGLVRLMHVVLIGHSTDFLDVATFWSNRLIFLANGVAGAFLYWGNTREVKAKE